MLDPFPGDFPQRKDRDDMTSADLSALLSEQTDAFNKGRRESNRIDAFTLAILRVALRFSDREVAVSTLAALLRELGFETTEPILLGAADANARWIKVDRTSSYPRVNLTPQAVEALAKLELAELVPDKAAGRIGREEDGEVVVLEAETVVTPLSPLEVAVLEEVERRGAVFLTSVSAEGLDFLDDDALRSILDRLVELGSIAVVNGLGARCWAALDSERCAAGIEELVPLAREARELLADRRATDSAKKIAAVESVELLDELLRQEEASKGKVRGAIRKAVDARRAELVEEAELVPAPPEPTGNIRLLDADGNQIGESAFEEEERVELEEVDVPAVEVGAKTVAGVEGAAERAAAIGEAIDLAIDNMHTVMLGGLEGGHDVAVQPELVLLEEVAGAVADGLDPQPATPELLPEPELEGDDLPDAIVFIAEDETVEIVEPVRVREVVVVRDAGEILPVVDFQVIEPDAPGEGLDLAARITALASERDAASLRADELRKVVNESTDRISDLLAANDAAGGIGRALAASRDEAKDRIIELRSELSRKDRAIDDLRGDLQRTRADLIESERIATELGIKVRSADQLRAEALVSLDDAAKDERDALLAERDARIEELESDVSKLDAARLRERLRANRLDLDLEALRAEASPPVDYLLIVESLSRSLSEVAGVARRGTR
jgi:hypothetical protein